MARATLRADGEYALWDGTDTTEVAALAGRRWLRADADGTAYILGKDDKPLVLHPGWVAFRQDGKDWLVAIAAEPWEAWTAGAA